MVLINNAPTPCHASASLEASMFSPQKLSVLTVIIRKSLIDENKDSGRDPSVSLSALSEMFKCMLYVCVTHQKAYFPVWKSRLHKQGQQKNETHASRSITGSVNKSMVVYMTANAFFGISIWLGFFTKWSDIHKWARRLTVKKSYHSEILRVKTRLLNLRYITNLLQFLNETLNKRQSAFMFFKFTLWLKGCSCL